MFQNHVHKRRAVDQKQNDGQNCKARRWSKENAISDKGSTQKFAREQILKDKVYKHQNSDKKKPVVEVEAKKEKRMRQRVQVHAMSCEARLPRNQSESQIIEG